MDDSIINIENVTKEIKGNVILNNINITLQRNHIYGFIGHNGSGKTMLFKTICGFVKPTNGQVLINNKILGKDICFPENTGLLIESAGFLPNLNAFENLKLLANIQNKITDSEIRQSLNLVGLNPDDKKKLKKYSLGMRQKLGIAQAIMEKPEILILDEPMNALDYTSVENMRNIILTMKNKGCTILLASHNRDDIDLLADKVFELNNGVLRCVS